MSAHLSSSSSSKLETVTRDVVVKGLVAGYAQGLTSERRLVASGLDLVLPAGRIIALMGSNGSGKSTILRAIVDERFRTAGSVSVGGAPLRSSDVAFMPQNSASTLFPWRTGARNVTLWDEIHNVRNPRPADDLAREYGIGPPLDRRVTTLSGGERVQIALLRALAVPNHKLAVFDEPFEGLDAGNRTLVIELLRRLAREGKPIILTTHRLEDIQAVGAVAYLVAGRPVQTLKEVVVPSRFTQAVPERNTEIISITSNVAREPMPRPRITTGAYGILAGLIAWAAISAAFGRPTLVPSPRTVGLAMWTLASDGGLIRDVAMTLARATGAWAIGLSVAIPLGTFLGYHRTVYSLISPWLSLARGFPVFTLTGVAIGLFVGAAETQRLFLIALTVLLIALQVVASAAFTAPRRRVDIARVFGAGELFCLFRVMLFESIGGILGALETTLPLAFVLTLVIESFLIPEVGLGRFVLNSLQGASVATTIAAVFWPALIAAIGVALIRRFARRWQFEL